MSGEKQLGAEVECSDSEIDVERSTDEHLSAHVVARRERLPLSPSTRLLHRTTVASSSSVLCPRLGKLY